MNKGKNINTFETILYKIREKNLYFIYLYFSYFIYFITKHSFPYLYNDNLVEPVGCNL
jgi:hypothetical protein